MDPSFQEKSLWLTFVSLVSAFGFSLLAFWVVAQLVEIGSQLFLYRRGT